jgi:hypothetical protein
VISQRVGDFVAHDLGDLVVGGVQFFDQAGINRHFPARHAPGIDRLRFIDHLDTPFPAGRLRAHSHRLADQPFGDRRNALFKYRVVVDLALLGQGFESLCIGRFRSADGLLFRDQHELSAPGGAGGAGNQQETDQE